MISNKDIYASAQLLIKQHGSKAAEHADKRMKELMAADDTKGAGVWLAIGQAIHDLQKLSSTDKLH